MSTLTILTLVLVGLVVLVLVVYLVGIIVSLWRAGTELEKLAGALQQVAADTAPLADHVGVVNGGLTQLRAGLQSVDRHLVGVAGVLKL